MGANKYSKYDFVDAVDISEQVDTKGGTTLQFWIYVHYTTNAVIPHAKYRYFKPF